MILKRCVPASALVASISLAPFCITTYVKEHQPERLKEVKLSDIVKPEQADQISAHAWANEQYVIITVNQASERRQVREEMYQVDFRTRYSPFDVDGLWARFLLGRYGEKFRNPVGLYALMTIFTLGLQIPWSIVDFATLPFRTGEKLTSEHEVVRNVIQKERVFVPHRSLTVSINGHEWSIRTGVSAIPVAAAWAKGKSSQRDMNLVLEFRESGQEITIPIEEILKRQAARPVRTNPWVGVWENQHGFHLSIREDGTFEGGGCITGGSPGDGRYTIEQDNRIRFLSSPPICGASMLGRVCQIVHTPEDLFYALRMKCSGGFSLGGAPVIDGSRRIQDGYQVLVIQSDRTIGSTTPIRRRPSETGGIVERESIGPLDRAPLRIAALKPQEQVHVFAVTETELPFKDRRERWYYICGFNSFPSFGACSAYGWIPESTVQQEEKPQMGPDKH